MDFLCLRRCLVIAYFLGELFEPQKRATEAGRRTNIEIICSIILGQACTWKKFNSDWKDLKSKPTPIKVIRFIHKMFWVAIAQSGVRAIQFMSNAQAFLLRFLREKCDKHLGRNGK